MKKKVTKNTLINMKKKGEKIAALTSYDYLSTRILDDAGIDLILVGDSLGMVVLGYDNTLPVTVEEIIHHLKAVSRTRPRALLVGDLPFMSYQASVEDAVRNAGRLVKEGGAESVKLEGGDTRSRGRIKNQPRGCSGMPGAWRKPVVSRLCLSVFPGTLLRG